MSITNSMTESDYLQLENSSIRLSLAPYFGARIISLVDKRTNRDWLVKGELVADSSDNADYGALQARGWDECFPTVAPCSGEGTPWENGLRDHGALWGRPWTCNKLDNKIVAIYHDDIFSFSRTIMLVNNELHIHYSVENLTDKALPYLWSQHCLLATTPADSIELCDVVAPFRSTYCTNEHRVETFNWPTLKTDFPSLEQIQAIQAKFALKAYSSVNKSFRATIGREEGVIQFDWINTDIPFIGLWLNYGGWSHDKTSLEQACHQIAIEPTTGAADCLAQAMAKQQARILQPGEKHLWNVKITLINA